MYAGRSRLLLYYMEVIMKARMIGLAAALVLGSFIGTGMAAEENHKAEAMTHTQAAIEHGGMGHGSILAQHAEMALKHAEMAEKEKPNTHMEQGIEHLKAAIAEGKKDNADTATNHAKQALDHIRQSP
jgi:anti-sigma28 factor (negative regulator of flagellin synthesis)